MIWTDTYGDVNSFGLWVEEDTYERVINYGSTEKPFRLKFRRVLKIGFRL